MFLFDRPTRMRMVTPERALRGRAQRPFALSGVHAVLGTPIEAAVPDGFEELVVGMGCFWGAERAFWRLDGVWTTAVGYAGGITPNPTYEEVCSGRTGHAEVVRVVYDPVLVDTRHILKAFWEGHDPTQGMRQGNDIGTQYRSAIYWTNPEQETLAIASRKDYAASLTAAGLGDISTEIARLPSLYYAEEYHQQYLHKNPRGYCGLGGTGVSCPIGLASA